MTEQLLPCPLCGGEADYCETNSWWIRCNKCNAETEADMSPEAAAEIWNRRTPPPSSHVPVCPHLRAAGIGRDPENDRVVFLSLNRAPSDDEMRAIHGAISRTPATCPFCTKPTYVLPCSHCDEPDVPDHEF